MVRSKKRSEHLSSFLKEARKRFPNTSWNAYQADKTTNEVYGPGFILVGRRGVLEKEYFILYEDNRRMPWAAMINGQIDMELHGRVH